MFNILSLFHLILCLCVYTIVQCTQIHFQAELLNDGFHKTLAIESLSDKPIQNLLIYQEIPQEYYADPDELRQYEILMGIESLVVGDAAIEQFSHLSTPQTILVYLSDVKDNFSINVPIHLRPQASKSCYVEKGVYNPYTRTEFSLPKYYHNITCDNPIQEACDKSNNTLCDWYLIEVSTTSDILSSSIPHGCKEDSLMVTVFTTIVVFLSISLLIFSQTYATRLFKL